jgi:hypothetical protein
VAKQPRVSIDRSGGRLRAVARHRAHYAVGAFLSLWLGGWAIGEVFAVRLLLSGKLPILPALFVLLWAAGWTFFGYGAFWTMAWHLAGREEIEVEGGKLSLAVAAGPLRSSQRYDAREIRNLRHDPSVSSSIARALGTARPEHGAIAFEYRARTVRFGAELERDEAELVLDMIRERLPDLRAA